MEVKTSNGIIFGLFVAPEVKPTKEIKAEQAEVVETSAEKPEKKTSPKKGK